MQIHESAEDYLEAILMLREKTGAVRAVDVAEALTGEDGCLPRNLTFEGIHLNTAGCRVWLEYLRTHGVEQ